MWVLRLPVQHPKIKRIGVRAGIVAGWSVNMDGFIVTNIKVTVAAERATENERGRTNDDKRSLVQQSIICSCLPPQRCFDRR